MTDSDFNTPPWLLTLIRQLDSRGIGLDPCSNRWSMVKARVALTVEDDGLSQSWRGEGLVFVNPPHSTSPNNIEPWADKAVHEFGIRDDFHGSDSLVMLVPAKTDTGWFHHCAARVSCRCFLRGRPKYWHHGKELPGPGKFASMVLYQGPSVGRFMGLFSPYGWVI